MSPSIARAVDHSVDTHPGASQPPASQTLGQRLRMAREVSRVDARAAGAHIARSPETVRAYEQGRVAPAAWQLELLGALYGVSVRWLETGEGPGPASPASDAQLGSAGLPPAYPAPPPEPPGYSIRRPLAPGQPRRYRLVCPECGKPWAPEDLGRHLVTGDGCNQPHSMSEAEALIATAKRDIGPWLRELERLDEMLDDLRRRRDGTKDKTSRKVFAMSIELVEIQREKIIHCGPEKYEWHDD